MAHNVKIRYYARENSQLKPHSFFAQPIPNGTYGFDQLCQEASENAGIDPDDIRKAVNLYMREAKKRLLDGFRVEVGSQFLTLGPGLTAKVKDELNADGTVKTACTADDLKATGGKSRVTATVNSEFSREFAASVKWQKADKSGNIIEDDEDDATLDADDEQQQGAGSGESTGSGEGSGQGTGDNGGSGSGDEPFEG